MRDEHRCWSLIVVIIRYIFNKQPCNITNFLSTMQMYKFYVSAHKLFCKKIIMLHKSMCLCKILFIFIPFFWYFA